MVATASTEHSYSENVTQQTQAPAKSLEECSVEAVATMIGCLPTQALAVKWKPGLRCRIWIINLTQKTAFVIVALFNETYPGCKLNKLILIRNNNPAELRMVLLLI